MRTYGIVIIGICVVLGLLFAWYGRPQSAAIQPFTKEETRLDTVTSQREVATNPENAFGEPKLIKIPDLDITSAVESVGLDENRSMDVPKEWENVAWYNLGFTPGEVGNAVIAGHFDSPDGGPAVFYRLSELQPGQEIIVTDDSENELTYVVTASETYDFDTFPIKTVFGAFDKPRLNLITCDGVYNKAEKNYSQRTVVFSELKK